MMTACTVATRLRSELGGERFPTAEDWRRARPTVFDADWRGETRDPDLETQVRLLWNSETLFAQFRARYRTITTFAGSKPGGRRDQLWERDVAEVFLQSDPAQPRRYKEFEISPNGLWIDLHIDLDTPERKQDMCSGLRRKATILSAEKIWTAELAIPMRALATEFDPRNTWRVNFYRVEGATEPRFYSAWRPTHTPQPNFHVPEAFGKLSFTDE